MFDDNDLFDEYEEMEMSDNESWLNDSELEMLEEPDQDECIRSI